MSANLTFLFTGSLSLIGFVGRNENTLIHSRFLTAPKRLRKSSGASLPSFLSDFQADPGTKVSSAPRPTSAGAPLHFYLQRLHSRSSSLRCTPLPFRPRARSLARAQARALKRARSYLLPAHSPASSLPRSPALHLHSPALLSPSSAGALPQNFTTLRSTSYGAGVLISPCPSIQQQCIILLSQPVLYRYCLLPCCRSFI